MHASRYGWSSVCSEVSDAQNTSPSGDIESDTRQRGSWSSENRRLRDQRQLLLDACRTSREVLQSTVRRFAREMNDAGMSQPAALSQLTARIDAVAFVLHDDAGIERLKQDVARWCGQEFEAA